MLTPLDGGDNAATSAVSLPQAWEFFCRRAKEAISQLQNGAGMVGGGGKATETYILLLSPPWCDIRQSHFSKSLSAVGIIK